MTTETEGPTPFLKRRTTRRAVLGGTLTAASLAAAYAALGTDLLHNEAVRGDNAALDSESVRISHLLRRTGFGVTRDEYDRYQGIGLDATIDELVNFTAVDDSQALELANQLPIDANNRATPTAWWLVRIANTKRPLQEKMTLFWHGLLTSQISVVRDPLAMVAQNEFFRSHAMDSFPTILRGISQDAAMMVYLDLDGSQKEAPNENYARELMELFALGIGNYTESDVREAARAFTGWQVPRNRINGAQALLEPVFRPQRFDDGTKNFLGRTGNLQADDIIDTIVAQPASAAYIVGRLFAFFVYPDPTEKELAPFVQVYNDNDRRIGAVVESILRSEVFYSAKAYRALVKMPVEYAVGAVKALGAQANVAQLLANGGQIRGGGLIGDMGQTLFEPPSVAGWPGGETWLNSATIFARLNFINAVAGGAGRDNARGAITPSLNLGTAEQASAYFLPFLMDDNLPDESRQVFLDYAASGSELTPEQLRGLAYLVLGAPQFHLA